MGVVLGLEGGRGGGTLMVSALFKMADKLPELMMLIKIIDQYF